MTAGLHAATVRLTCDDCAITEVVERDGAAAGTEWTVSPYGRGRHLCPECSPPGEPPADLSIAITSPAAVVRVTGRVDLRVVPALRSTLENAVELHPYVIVDLTAARDLGTVGVGVLRRARTAARRRRGDLLIAAAPGQKRWNREFRTFATVPQAITAVVGRP
ncbi:STAS domain-containing protein [Paractinoplanes brasiliensis]|uniref:Anti-anti-sigma regulatory factor n=1 Tax=Paractinoplanes brasiliensis TaxID=52695 RepID=A0A4R6JB03_9ACTN|nr:STAS domain-containing protein [Actinoplanes brasiliensis]TDO32437.1 anti-anti-sigma regulatory factor [Actinoplanes brasiliensis]GID27691.1 hypothetical protein Abr02nite_26740 [Actinoplanes brasiliensis]